MSSDYEKKLLNTTWSIELNGVIEIAEFDVNKQVKSKCTVEIVISE